MIISVGRDDIGKIPYTVQCLKEAMRVFPPVPVIGRELSENLNVNGSVIRKGTNVTINILGCHHNPTVWGDDHMVRTLSEKKFCKLPLNLPRKKYKYLNHTNTNVLTIFCHEYNKIPSH